MPSFSRAVLQRATLPIKAVLAGLALGVASCSVTAVDPESLDTAVNECDTRTDCPSGSCVDGRCQATRGFFSTMLVEVSPPATGTDFAGVNYLHRLDDLDLEGEQREIRLALPVTVTGQVSLRFDGTTECQPLFVEEPSGPSLLGSPLGIPVSVSFTPSDRILGVASTKYDAEVDIGDDEGEPLSFDVDLPPGDYDIYVRPRAQAVGGCEIPPTLLRRFKVEATDLLLNLPLPSPAFSFRLTIKWPNVSGQPKLNGWTVDMLDPHTGLVISTQGTLGDPLGQGPYDEYETTVAYAPVTLEGMESEFVRLAPPAGVDAPTVIMARSGLELFGTGSGVIDLSEQFLGFPEAVTVEGQLALSGIAEPTAGRVTLVSTSIEGMGEGVFASFVRSAEADDDGNFTMRLLPGTYRVYAWPQSLGVTSSASVSAATQTDWVIAAEPAVQAGKTVELLPPAHITGKASLPQGEPASGATVIANASPRDVQTDLLTQAAQGNLAVAPAAQSAIVAGDGAFDLQADPGIFDVSVRAPEGSGFAWYVASQVHVEPAKELKLGTPILPLPVPYSGRVVVVIDSGTSVPLAEALLRAYVYLDENNAYTGDPTRAASVVQIGETRADADGNFELLIPANLN